MCTFMHIRTCVWICTSTEHNFLTTKFQWMQCTHVYTFTHMSAHLQTFVRNCWAHQKWCGHILEKQWHQMGCFPASFFIQPSWSWTQLGLGIRLVLGGRILKCTWDILQIWTKWKMSVLLLHHELFSLFWNNSLPNFPLPKMHQEATQLTVF